MDLADAVAIGTITVAATALLISAIGAFAQRKVARSVTSNGNDIEELKKRLRRLQDDNEELQSRLRKQEVNFVRCEATLAEKEGIIARLEKQLDRVKR